MNETPPNQHTGNYFALPRLIAKWRGGSSLRVESNWLEAYLAGGIVYLISYLFAANLLLTKLRLWPALILLPILVVAMWLFWLIALYLHSLLVRACWSSGLCTDLSRNRIQSVLMGTLTSAFAAQLITSGSWLRWIGVIWMLAVTLNLSAALFLAVVYDERS